MREFFKGWRRKIGIVITIVCLPLIAIFIFLALDIYFNESGPTGYYSEDVDPADQPKPEEQRDAQQPNTSVTMREFFKPWRRKVGVVALLMACLIASGWLRSLVASDAIATRWVQLISLDGVFIIQVENLSHMRYVDWDSEEHHPVNQKFSEEERRQLRSLGISFGLAISTDRWLLVVPYWMMTTFLILLSAYLLLPKQPTMRTSEPPKDEP